MIHLVRAGPVTLAYYACKQSYANNTVIMCYFSSIFSSLTQLGIISFFIAIWPMAIASHLILSVILFIDITDHKWLLKMIFSLLIFLPLTRPTGNRGVVIGIGCHKRGMPGFEESHRTRWRHIRNEWENSRRSFDDRSENWMPSTHRWRGGAIMKQSKNCRKQNYVKRKSFARSLLCHYAAVCWLEIGFVTKPTRTFRVNDGSGASQNTQPMLWGVMIV